MAFEASHPCQRPRLAAYGQGARMNLGESPQRDLTSRAGRLGGIIGRRLQQGWASCESAKIRGSAVGAATRSQEPARRREDGVKLRDTQFPWLPCGFLSIASVQNERCTPSCGRRALRSEQAGHEHVVFRLIAASALENRRAKLVFPRPARPADLAESYRPCAAVLGPTLLL